MSCSQGANAKPELIEIADLVSEVQAVKHPFKHGAQGAEGGVGILTCGPRAPVQPLSLR